MVFSAPDSLNPTDAPYIGSSLRADNAPLLMPGRDAKTVRTIAPLDDEGAPTMPDPRPRIRYT